MVAKSIQCRRTASRSDFSSVRANSACAGISMAQNRSADLRLMYMAITLSVKYSGATGFPAPRIGCSQSPKPISTSPSGLRTEYRYDKYRSIDSLHSCAGSRSPRMRQICQQSSVRMLSHAGPLPHAKPHPPVGTIPGRLPRRSCARQMLRSHSRKLLSGVSVSIMCSADAAASPVQPFFSRCGQSVGK